MAFVSKFTKHTKDLKKFNPIFLGCLHNIPPGPGFPHGGVFMNLEQEV